MKRLLMIVSLFLLVILGCFSKPDKASLVGKYCFNRSDSRDSIFINIDSTYTHQYISSEGEVFKVTGKWEYVSIDNEILFKDFVFFTDSGASDEPPGNWFSRIRTVGDTEIRLMYSSEDNIFFYKKK